MAESAGVEPALRFRRLRFSKPTQCRSVNLPLKMAGLGGFEPPSLGFGGQYNSIIRHPRLVGELHPSGYLHAYPPALR